MVNVPNSEIGIKVAKTGLIIPYLMFVDDCFIFAKKTGQQPGISKSFLGIIVTSQANC